MSRQQVWKVIGLTTLLFCALQFSSAQGVTFITFDAPGTVPGSGYTQPQAINPAGVVTGFFTDSSGINEGFVRALDGTITPINLGTDTEPQAINLTGTIVGWYRGQLAGQSGVFGFVRAPNGNVSPLNFGNVNYTQAFGINQARAITGTYLYSGIFHGFILRPGATSPIPFDGPSQGLPITVTVGKGINPQGAITGFFTESFGSQHCFLRAPNGSITPFDPQGSGVITRVNFPVAINLAGTITGYYQDASLSPGTHAFLRASNGTLTTIDAPAILNPANPSLTFALDINPAGTIRGLLR